MKVIRKGIVLFSLLAFCVITLVGGALEYSVFDGYEGVVNRDYDMNFISVDRAKSLFAPQFQPLMPSYDLSTASYESCFVEGTLGDGLLEKEGNYYLALNNPDKKYFSERSIYEAYSLTIATPSIWENPAFYGLEEGDLIGYTHESAWIDYDYLIGKLEGYENKVEIASSLLGYAEKQNYDDWNDMPYYHIFESDAEVSYVTFSAYSDSIASDKLNNNYPRTLKYTESDNNTRKNTPLQYFIKDVYVEIEIVEEKTMAFDPNDLVRFFGEKDGGVSWTLDANCCLLKTYVTANFRIDEINYSLIVPLMNRLISYDSQDYGAWGTSDFDKLQMVAQKTINHFVGVLK